MSPLTKMFVVLLVVLSLLLTAATVVYVNKEDVQKQALDKTKLQLAAKETEAVRANEALTAAQLNASAIQQQSNDQARAASAAAATAQRQIADLNVQLAKSNSTGATQMLDISRLTEALKASQDSGTKLQDEVARLRGSNDTLVRQASDLNATVSDLTNKLDVTERERRNLAEQLTQSTGENQRLGAALKGAGISPDQAGQYVNKSGMPAINGVIRARQNIAGREYATISVGSADGVSRGMQFNIIDRNTGNFLGTLVVDTVEPNEAVGRLDGPRVAEIRPGVEVRTQL